MAMERPTDNTDRWEQAFALRLELLLQDYKDAMKMSDSAERYLIKVMLQSTLKDIISRRLEQLTPRELVQ